MNNCDIKVTIYFIRHGFSCANSLQNYGWKGRIQKAIDPRGFDPELTYYAINQIRNERKNITKIIGGDPDIVISSILLRAIQTGRYLFPKNKIVVAPFLKEFGFGVDNIPSNPKKHIEKDPNLRKNVIYDLVLSGNKFKSWTKKDDYNKFMYEWLPEFLRYILQEQPRIKYKHGIKIAIIGHSGFMKKYIQSVEKDTINNIGIVELHFCFNLKKRKMYAINCPKIKSFQGINCDKMGQCYDNSTSCNKLIFHGFPKNNIIKETFKKQRGDRNCYY